MGMTLRVYAVTADDVTELVPRHEVAPVSAYSISDVLPPCQCPLHRGNVPVLQKLKYVG